MIKTNINWKIFSILLSLSLISIVCVFPYIVSIQGELLRSTGQPLGLIFAAQILQSAIMFAVMIFFGLILTKRINFQLPLLEALAERKDYKKKLKNIFREAILIGVGVAGIIYGLDTIFTFLGAGITTHTSLAPVWQKLLAAVYGGVTEEIVMRLFLMSLMIWIAMKLFRQKQPSKINIWVSIVLASVVFGLGHLPITASVTTINALVISRAIVLNGVGGVVFGWLFWKRGLEAAMIAHFTADIFLLTLLPLIIK